MRGGNAVFLQNRDFFGAMVVHIPLLDALREADPGAPLVVYTPFERARMFTELGLADEVRLYSGAGHALWHELRERSFERIVLLRPQSSGLTAMIGASGARRLLGYSTAISRAVFSHTVRRDVSIYRATNYLNLVRGEIELSAFEASIRRLAARSTERAEIDEHVQEGGVPYCFMPCSLDTRKQWGDANFVALAQRIAERDEDARFLLVLGRQEAHYGQRFAESGLAARTRTLVDANVMDIARAVLRCAVVIANDCGSSHVAQLSDVPLVSIFGNWDGEVGSRIAEWFNPRANAVCLTTRTAAPIHSVPVDAVLDAILEVRDHAHAVPVVVYTEPRTADLRS